jgi:fibronectin-binding autotransporter adhesin
VSACRAAYDGYEIDTQRTAVIGANLYSASASYDAHRVEALAEVGHVFHGEEGTLEPYAGAGLSWLDVAGFTETGGGAANLTGAGDTDTLPYSTLGLRYASVWIAGAMRIAPSLDVAWRHVFGDVTPTAALAFAATPLATWTVAGAPITRDSLLVSAGLDAHLSQALAATLYYHGDVAERRPARRRRRPQAELLILTVTHLLPRGVSGMLPPSTGEACRAL